LATLGRPRGTKERWNVGKRTKSVSERFWEKVSVPDDTSQCWEWQANIVYGYGMFVENRKSILAHRWSYIFHNGEIPEGLYVLHKCDNRKCVNPQHLFLGTYKDNAVDRQRKGRGVIPDNRGENHGMSRLTESAVREIRELHKAGVPAADIGSRFGIDRRTVGKVANRKSWKHVQ